MKTLHVLDDVIFIEVLIISFNQVNSLVASFVKGTVPFEEESSIVRAHLFKVRSSEEGKVSFVIGIALVRESKIYNM